MSTRSLFLTYPFSPDNPLTFSVATFSGRLYLSLKVLFVLSVWFGFFILETGSFAHFCPAWLTSKKHAGFLHCRKCRSGAIGLATNWWYQALNCRNCRRFDRLRFCLVRNPFVIATETTQASVSISCSSSISPCGWLRLSPLKMKTPPRLIRLTSWRWRT